MSRAFVKEDASGEDVVVTHRAPLPDGVPNLVTPAGLTALERERDERRHELEVLMASEPTPDGRRKLAAAEEELELLLGRVATAQVVGPPPGRDEAGVGATVTVRYLSGPQAGRTAEFTVVGVDEADPLEGLVAFTAPVAQALLGQRAGAEGAFMAGDTELRVRLERVSY